MYRLSWLFHSITGMLQPVFSTKTSTIVLGQHSLEAVVGNAHDHKWSKAALISELFKTAVTHSMIISMSSTTCSKPSHEIVKGGVERCMSISPNQTQRWTCQPSTSALIALETCCKGSQLFTKRSRNCLRRESKPRYLVLSCIDQPMRELAFP